MTSMETQQQAIRRLRAQGYDADLWIAEGGTLTDGSKAWDPENAAVEHLVRFEGASNPDDEAMVLGVSIIDGPRGIVTLPYGPNLSGPQAQTVKRLALERPNETS